MTDNVPVLTKYFVIENRHSVILRVRYNTIIFTGLQRTEYLLRKTNRNERRRLIICIIAVRYSDGSAGLNAHHRYICKIPSAPGKDNHYGATAADDTGGRQNSSRCK